MTEQSSATAPNYETAVESNGSNVNVFVPESAFSSTLEEADKIRTELAEDEPTLARLGVTLSDVSGGVEIIVPKADGLNENLFQMGITDRKFVDVQGDIIPPVPYLTHISKGELPIASQDKLILHDAGNHMAGFVELPPRAIQLFKQAAAEALSSQDPKLIDEAINMVEVWTGITLSRTNLAVLYSKRMNPKIAAILAWKDLRGLHQKSKSVPTMAKEGSSQTSVNDHGLPIY